MGEDGWHKEDIKAAIRKKGITVKELSLRYGLRESACREALIRRNLRGEQVIASFLGVTARELWPDRYNQDGTPMHQVVRREPTAPSRGRHRQTPQTCKVEAK